MTLMGLFNLCVAVFCFIATLINIKESRYDWVLVTTLCMCLNIFAALCTSSLIK